MSIHDTFKLVRLALLAAVAMTTAGSEAMAWRGGYYYYGGGYGIGGGAYASYGVPYTTYTAYYGAPYGGYYGGYYCGYNIRPLGPSCPLVTRIRARRAARAYYSYGCGACCGYGCYLCGCGSVCGDPCSCDPCSCDPCCEANVCCDSTSSPIIQEAPVESQDGMPTPAEPTPADSSDSSETSALFKVTLPASAKIYVNGQLTRSIGSQRRFVSRGLQPGLHYSYRLRVEFEHNGRPIVRYRTVDVMAGNTVLLDFHNLGNNTDQLAQPAAASPNQAESSRAGKSPGDFGRFGHDSARKTPSLRDNQSRRRRALEGLHCPCRVPARW